MTESISNALESAVIRTCEACNAPSDGTAGGYSLAGRSVGVEDLRQTLDVWWRFNLLFGDAEGESNAFQDGYSFERRPIKASA